MTPTPSGFDRLPQRSQTVLNVVQTIFYTLAIVAILVLAALFYSHMRQQERYHDRQDIELKELLRENRTMLKDHEQQRMAHDRLLRQP